MSGASVYTELREAIGRGELVPSQSLVETDLMTRYDAGRPAVRTAIVRLEQDGLVERVKNHSAHVRLVPDHEALEIYEARTLLESAAAAQAATRATPFDVQELRALLARVEASRAAGRLADVTNGDTCLHQRILSLAGNGTIIRLCDSLHGHLVRYHHRTRLEQESASDAPQEHRQIVEAIAANDPIAAAAAMTTHLERLSAILRRALTS